MAIWNVKTYHKKSCEQRELYLNNNLDRDGKITVIDGFRLCEYEIETTDDNFPDFKFVSMYGEDGKKDSIDLNNCYNGNIENSMLIEMYDGGCWGEVIFENFDNEEEEDRLRELIEEEGAYALEESDEGWFLDETEVWVCGPLVVTDEEGNERIIVADENGNVVNFEEE